MTAISGLAGDLRGIVGNDHVVEDPEELRRLSGDLSHEPFEPALALARPKDAEETAAVVRVAARAQVPVIARGAARSYTRSHTPVTPNALLIDMRRLDGIDTSTVDDLYVTAGAGASWERLYLALADHGVRTPFWGTLSGRQATIGGTLSQNAAFFGAASHGTAADSVLGLDVVLSDGRRLRTGASAHPAQRPFARQHGPDLTGLFLGDAGALGVKVEATLALVPTPPVTVAAAFAFDSQGQAIEAMTAMARHRLAAQIFRFDRYYHGLLQQVGFRGYEDLEASVHVLVDGIDTRDAEGRLDVLRQAANAQEIDASLGFAMLADPFGLTRHIFEHAEEAAHMPIHAVVPFSAATEAARRMEHHLTREAGLDRLNASCWTMAMVVDRGVLIEASIVVPPRPPADPSWPTLLQTRRTLAGLLDDLGALHFQLGKYYPYQALLADTAWDTLGAIKHLLDPERRLNPEALGL